MEVKIDVGNGKIITLTEDNCWVCIFTEAPIYNHVYLVRGSDASCIFECRTLLDHLMHLGFPLQVRRYPTEWDEDALSQYLEQQVNRIDDELDKLGGENED